MVCIHSCFMTLGLESSSSHWDTTPVVVGVVVVEGGSLEGPGVALAGAMDPEG